MIRLFRCDKVFDSLNLPETIFDKVEVLDLKRALYKYIPPYIELTINEYEQIKDKTIMPTIQIKTNAYYGNPSYYSVMPQEIFDALELASLQGEEYTTVGKDQFDKMIVEYDKKMKQCEQSNM